MHPKPQDLTEPLTSYPQPSYDQLWGLLSLLLVLGLFLKKELELEANH
jgi:hypothetical protein